MSNLEDLEKKLYKQIENENLSERIKKTDPAIEELFKEIEERKKGGFDEEKVYPKKPKKRKNFFLIISLFLILIVFSGALIFYYTRKNFDESLVSLEIKGPKIFVAGDKIILKVNYKNGNKVALKNASIIFEWPQNSIVGDGTTKKIKKEISLIVPFREASVEFEGIVFGVKNEKLEFSASFIYTPENINSTFEKQTSFISEIVSTPISLKIETPSFSVIDKEFEIAINYLNSSASAFSDMSLKIDYPINFVFISSNPAPNFSNNQWVLGNLTPKKTGNIKITGKLISSGGFSQFKATIGKESGFNFISYNEETASIDLSTSVLVIFSQVNNAREYIASSEETLNYKINYKNTSSIPIANVVISAKLDGKVLDFKTLNIQWGAYNGDTDTIIWNASGVKNLGLLNPQEEGEVSFTIKVKKPLPVSNFYDKNFTVSFTSKIDSTLVPEILRGAPIGMEDKIETKIKSSVALSVSGLYKDSLFENSGPIPPRIGAKTTYTVYFSIINSSNDLENIKIETILPSYIEWLNKTYSASSDAKFNFDISTGQLVIEIPKISAGAGVTSKIFQVAFQIGITPFFNQVNSAPILVEKSRLIAKDAFTFSDIEIFVEKMTTEINDSFVGSGGGKVIQ